MSEVHMYHFYFVFNLHLHVFHVHFCCFRIGRSRARNYRNFEKIDIIFINIMYNCIFLNFGVIYS